MFVLLERLVRFERCLYLLNLISTIYNKFIQSKIKFIFKIGTFLKKNMVQIILRPHYKLNLTVFCIVEFRVTFSTRYLINKVCTSIQILLYSAQLPGKNVRAKS